jgi:hypothetical protein
LRSFRGTVTWTKCRFRHKTGNDCQKTSPFMPNKGHYEHLTVPVLDQSVSISACLVPVSRKDPKKYCITKTSNLIKLPLWYLLGPFLYSSEKRKEFCIFRMTLKSGFPGRNSMEYFRILWNVEWHKKRNLRFFSTFCGMSQKIIFFKSIFSLKKF